jgi:multidrug efflux pump subunit AcrA (membrane-fusion protein)
VGYLLTIDRLPIRAPISGLVADVDFVPGQWVQAGQELMRILDERQVRVEVPLFGENLTRALRSRSAFVRTSALPNRLFPARLRGLAPLASGGDGAAGEERSGEGGGAPIPPVLLSVVNEGSLLRPGMIVEASLELADSREVITVPEGAIVYQESGPAVFVHTAAELFELRPIALAGRYLDRVGIEGDVRDGERIVSEGAYSLVAAPAAMAPVGATTTKAVTKAAAGAAGK